MASAQPLRVLVIEDEPLIAMVIEFSIERLGNAVIGPIARLDDAIAAAAGNGYDCAVIDVNIQGGASFPVAEILVERGRPFILASGYDNWALPEHLRGHPRLVKPFSDLQLETELQLLFARCALDPA